jgi:SAM-dependent methyltransferase
MRKKDSEKARDENALIYDNWYIRTKGFYFDLLEKEAFISKINFPERILDIGCGTGRISGQYVKKNCEIVSLDFSQKSLDVYKRKISPSKLKKVRLIKFDIVKKRLKKLGRFDKVVSCQTIQHIPFSRSIELVNKIYFLLKKKGKFIFSVYSNNKLLYKEKEGFLDNGIYYRRFSLKDIDFLFSRSKFQKYRVYSLKFFPFYHIFKKGSKLGFIIYKIDKFFGKILPSKLFTGAYYVIESIKDEP